MNRVTSLAVGFALCLWLFAGPAGAQKANETAHVSWRDALRQKPEWYAGGEAARVADNLLLYQRDTGGWPKNIDMARALTSLEKSELARRKRDEDSTIDNGATYTQLVFLARVYTACGQARYRDAFFRGIDYLLRAQYENGGWPQYYPDLKGYRRRITFNDGAMINVMRLLRDVAQRKSDYKFVDEQRRARAEAAVSRGVELILKAQVLVAGSRTVWAAQHDEVTLAPAGARTFEPPALASAESAGILRFLLGVKSPDARMIESVEAAVAWFRKTRISGLRWVERRDASRPGGFERAAVRDPGAGPIWARFYEIGTDRPVFIGRDGVVKYDVMEIEAERRNGYAWYSEAPAEVLDEEYPEWLKKWLR